MRRIAKKKREIGKMKKSYASKLQLKFSANLAILYVMNKNKRKKKSGTLKGPYSEDKYISPPIT